MLREMTSSALAHSFKRFARCAVVGLALAGLAACGGGGGGSSTPAATTPTIPTLDPAPTPTPDPAPTPTPPEIPITPSAPTPEEFASATDITGQDTVEGRLDSADDEAFYKLQIDEPTVLRLEATSEDVDVEITLYDGEGNVLATSQAQAQVIPGIASASGPSTAAVPVAIAIGVRVAGPHFIRIAPKLVKAGKDAAKAAPFVLKVVTALYAVKQIVDFTEMRISLGANGSYDLKPYYDGEENVEVRFQLNSTLSTKWGTVGLTIGADYVLRHSSTPAPECGNQAEHFIDAEIDIVPSWPQGGVRPSLPGKEIPVRILREGAPRRKDDRPYEIAVTVQEFGSETVVLTDEIEDPEGGTLTFSVGSVPAGLRVTQNGATLAIAAQDGAMGGTITVTATDPDDECWNFPLRVQVAELTLPEMVVVPAGSFLMGGEHPDISEYASSHPVHRVTIARPFAVGVYEVTLEEWDACVSGGGCGGYRPVPSQRRRGRYPVTHVNWNDAKAYVRWLSEKTGEEYRLLSESEWEYAARAGTRTRYWWGDGALGAGVGGPRLMNAYQDYGGTLQVGSFPANAFGLYDMHGNVYEWVEDCWNDSYRGAPGDGSAWLSGDCSVRMRRGGGWDNSPSVGGAGAIALTSYGRSPLRAGYRGHRSTGFRVARTLTP